MRNSMIANLTMIMLSILTVSCEYKDIIDESDGNIMVNFINSRLDSVPKSMRVVCWPTDKAGNVMMSQGYTLFDVYNKPSNINLPSGEFVMAAWNNDGEHIAVYNLPHPKKCYLMSDGYYFGSNIRSLVRSVDSTVSLIDSIYHGSSLQFTADYTVLDKKDTMYVDSRLADQIISFTPENYTVKVNLKVNGIKNLGFASDIKGTLGNMAKRKYVLNNVTEDTTVVAFDCHWDIEKGQVMSTFYVWDLEPTGMSRLEHKLVLLVWMDDAKVFIPIDVSEAVWKAIDSGERNVNIETQNLGIDLRKFIGSSENSFDVIFDDWEEEEEELPV